MRTLLILLVFTGPAIADDLTPTTNNRTNTIRGDINGNINSELGSATDDQRQKRQKYGCTTDREGRTNCR